MIAPLLAFGIPGLLGAVFFAYCKATLDGPKAPIVVVDRRTMSLAHRRIAAALETGDLSRAYAGLTSLLGWLRYEIKTGPARRRLEYAQAIDQAELHREQLAETLGLDPAF